MKKVLVVSSPVPDNLAKIVNLKDYQIIACDQALLELHNLGIKPDLAIGDFDSLTNLELLDGIKTIKLNPIKDVSDTNYAVSYAYQYSSEVLIAGGIKGNRSDHLLANLCLFEKFPHLKMIDDTNLIELKLSGHYEIKKDRYQYLSVFAYEDTKITLSNVKYPLKDYLLISKNPLGLSNEIIGEVAYLDVKYGKLLVIHSCD